MIISRFFQSCVAGYRGVPPPPPGSSGLAKPPASVLILPSDEAFNGKDVPADQVIPLPNQHQRPNRGLSLDKPWVPEVVVDLPEVVREDQVVLFRVQHFEAVCTLNRWFFGSIAFSLSIRPNICPNRFLSPD